MNIAGIIQTIASIVSLKVSMRLSDQIAQAAIKGGTSVASGRTWMERATASANQAEKVKAANEAADKEKSRFQRMFARGNERLINQSETVDRASQRRDEAQGKYDVAKAARIGGQASGVQGNDLQKLFDAEDKYRLQLEKANDGLNRVTLRYQRLEAAINDQLDAAGKNVIAAQEAARAQKAAYDRAPKTKWEDRKRRASAVFRRMLGSKGRKAFEPVQKFAQRLNRDFARKRLATAKTNYKAATDAFKVNPTAAGGKAVQTAGSELAAARSMAVAAEACAGFAVALGVAAAAIGVVVAGVTAATLFVKQQLQAGEKRVEEIRKNRSKWNSSINGAVARYDQQTIDLDQRSASHTAGSATGVTASAMALRESTQKYSEEWEDIGNKLLATTLDIATFVSEIGKKIDLITPAASTSVDVLRFIAEKVGIPIKKIMEDMGKKNNIGVDALSTGLRANQDLKDRKRQNTPLPPLKTR